MNAQGQGGAARELHCRPPGLRTTHVRLGVQIAGRAAQWAREAAPGDCFVLADAAVVRCHGESGDLVVPGGEPVKTWASLGTVLEQLTAAGIDRGGTLVALGGGAVGDLGGLAASLHLRGIDLVMLPTTLLSMVDSSVGGKTAVNLDAGKNLVGTFWPAREVWIDLRWLSTLPEHEYRSGLGEVAKVALGLDADLLDRLEAEPEALRRRDPDALAFAIERCLRAKIDIVEQDPREGGARRLLNLGHTLAHALEAHSGYRLPHGLAVARGLHAALDVAAACGELPAAQAARGRALLENLGFARDPLPPAADLAPWLERDKKRAGDEIHVVLPDGAGSCHTRPMRPAEFLHLAGA